MPTELEELELPQVEAPEAEARTTPLRDRWANPKFRHAVLGAGALVLAAVLASFLYYHNRVSTDDAQVDGHLATVASKVYGNVAEVLVNDNQAVQAGQVLVRIDARDYQARLDQARATLALAEAQARAAEIGVPMMQQTTLSGTTGAAAALAAVQAEHERTQAAEAKSAADMAKAKAEVGAAEANSERAQADLARMKPLMEKEEISKQQYDAVRAEARVAESEVQAAREEFNSSAKDVTLRKAAVVAAKANIDHARAGVTQAHASLKQADIQSAQAQSAQAAVNQARANLAAAELQLSYTTVVAPVDGVVTKKSVESGQIVQPGQGLLVVIPLHDVWVTANFKETQLAKVRAGQRAEVKVDMYGKTFTGKVDSVAGATGTRLSLLPPENATGNYVKVVQRIPVKIVLDPQQGAVLRPGMNVEATIITK
ncbi:MAG: HlyD family secretion protein [Acidobacteriia bacterium]|nr:HlyD family secretion protein [Terriglobia bacterium]